MASLISVLKTSSLKCPKPFVLVFSRQLAVLQAVRYYYLRRRTNLGVLPLDTKNMGQGTRYGGIGLMVHGSDAGRPSGEGTENEQVNSTQAHIYTVASPTTFACQQTNPLLPRRGLALTKRPQFQQFWQWTHLDKAFLIH